jgi:FlaA1/EpsC-like NDP-sugar epimerase
VLNNKTIFITGGTGTFGQAFVSYLLRTFPNIGQIVIYSRDEQKQFEMMQELSAQYYPIKYILGDIRDKDQLFKAMKGASVVVHAAAMKHVSASEQNPMECVKTNVLGSQNIIDAALHNGVKKVVALSTDKSADAINAYGASKLLLEKLFVHADAQGFEDETRFSVVRYGNIFGSKGSVIPFFLKKLKRGEPLTVTHPEMTRFSITTQESIDLVMYALKEGWGGEIIIPKAPSYRILDVVEAIDPSGKYDIVGKRHGEKLHELLYSAFESLQTLERDSYYIICPHEGRWSKASYLSRTDAKEVAPNIPYSSQTNEQWLCVEQIRQMIETEKIV